MAPTGKDDARYIKMEGVNKIASDAQSSGLRAPSHELTWRQAALKIWKKLFDDNVFGRAAQLAYYWLFSIFPLLIFLPPLLPSFRCAGIWTNGSGLSAPFSLPRLTRCSKTHSSRSPASSAAGCSASAFS